MKLLIVTQIVDEQDPGLGFFCNWLKEFSTRFERIEVICLKEGKHSLPKNVRVHSLGKERGGNRLVYAFRFTYLAWKLKKEYDAVFVHMNPEYILLAGDQWLLSGKKVYLWYNHAVGSVWLRLAASLTTKIFHTSPYAYPARYKNAVQMPVGIDTTLFAPQNVARNRNAIYFQGRVAPAKKVHLLLEALRILRKTARSATATIVGPEDEAYGKKLRSEYADLVSSGAVTFLGPKQNEETPALYGAHGVSVNLTASGNFDKTMLEPMACETPVIVSSHAFATGIPDEWIVAEDDAQSLAQTLLRMHALPEPEYRALGESERGAVIHSHSLKHLADRLKEEISL